MSLTARIDQPSDVWLDVARQAQLDQWIKKHKLDVTNASDVNVHVRIRDKAVWNNELAASGWYIQIATIKVDNAMNAFHDRVKATGQRLIAFIEPSEHGWTGESGDGATRYGSLYDVLTGVWNDLKTLQQSLNGLANTLFQMRTCIRAKDLDPLAVGLNSIAAPARMFRTITHPVVCIKLDSRQNLAGAIAKEVSGLGWTVSRRDDGKACDLYISDSPKIETNAIHVYLANPDQMVSSTRSKIVIYMRQGMTSTAGYEDLMAKMIVFDLRNQLTFRPMEEAFTKDLNTLSNELTKFLVTFPVIPSIATTPS